MRRTRTFRRARSALNSAHPNIDGLGDGDRDEIYPELQGKLSASPSVCRCSTRP